MDSDMIDKGAHFLIGIAFIAWIVMTMLALPLALWKYVLS